MNSGICPRCQRELKSRRTRLGFHFECPGCHGRSLVLSAARRQFDADLLRDLWMAVKDAPPMEHRDALPCPYCRKKMHPTAVGQADGEFQIDVCRSCQLLWLDAPEVEAMPARAGGPKEVFLDNGYAPSPSNEASLRRARAAALTEPDRGGIPGRSEPQSLVQAALTWFGLPVEEDAPPVTARPWVTWSMIAICAVVFILQVTRGSGDEFLNLAYLPRNGLLDVTMLTAFFLHGGVFHLLGNMWFLHLVGDNVECKLGRVRYFLLIMAAAAAGALAHGLADPRGDIPVVGASAGVSGLMVYYALSWPKARLLFAIRLYWIPYWFSMGAAWALACWAGLQLVGAFLQITGMGGVSYFGHLGGAAIGALAFFLPRWIKPGGRPPRGGDFSDPTAVARHRR